MSFLTNGKFVKHVSFVGYFSPCLKIASFGVKYTFYQKIFVLHQAKTTRYSYDVGRIMLHPILMNSPVFIRRFFLVAVLKFGWMKF